MSGIPAAGDERRRDAFAAYVLPEIDVLLRVARTLVSRPADAEDLVQDTLLRAFRSIESFDGRHPRAWLLTIMRNAEVNRTGCRRPELLDDPHSAERVGDHDDLAASPEAVIVGETFDAVVVESLDALPDRFPPGGRAGRRRRAHARGGGPRHRGPGRDGHEPAAPGAHEDQGEIGGGRAGATEG